MVNRQLSTLSSLYVEEGGDWNNEEETARGRPLSSVGQSPSLSEDPRALLTGAKTRTVARAKSKARIVRKDGKGAHSGEERR